MDENKIGRRTRNKSKATRRKVESFCSWCKTTFANYNALIDHVCLPNRCSLCDKSFKEELELKMHKIKDHDFLLLKNGTPRLHANPASPEERRSCEICKKNLRGRQPICPSCTSTTSKDSDHNLSDENSAISSTILSDSTHYYPLLNNTAGNLFRRSRRISSSNSSRCSDSVGTRETGEATNSEKETSKSLDKTASQENRSRHSRRTNRFRSNSSEMSRHSESLKTEDADTTANKDKESVVTFNNKNMTSEKVSKLQHKRSASSEVLKLSESLVMQNAVDVVNEDAISSKKKESLKSVPNKIKKPESLSQCISKQSSVSSHSSNVSGSLEATISKGAINEDSSESTNVYRTISTEPIPNETSIVKKVSGHNRYRASTEVTNNALDAEPIDLSKYQDNMNPIEINAEKIASKKSTKQPERKETAARREMNKTGSEFAKSSKQTDKLKKYKKTENDIFNTLRLMPKNSSNLLENQRNCPENSNNETASESSKHVKQLIESCGTVSVAVNEMLSLKSNEHPIDLQCETAIGSNGDKPSSVLDKARRSRHFKNTQDQNLSIAVSRMGRKRNHESDDDNSVSPSRKKQDHTGRRNFKKTQNTDVNVAPQSDMVLIDTLIRSLPVDSGILLKRKSKDDLNIKCPKCNKLFRNPKLGSSHYPTCPINIELSKNRKILVSPLNVIWVCTLCHLNFNDHSKLTEHKKLCFNTITFSSSLAGKKCPKCCFECKSLIKLQNHPCEENIKKMQSCAITIDKIALLEKRGKKSLQYLECQKCNKLFINKQSFKVHARTHLHPVTVKTEVISLDDNEYADYSVQSANNATFNNHHITSGVSPDNSGQLTDSLHINVSASSTTNPQQHANDSSFETFRSSGPLPAFFNPVGNTDSSRIQSSQPNPTGDVFSEAFSASAQENLGDGLDFLQMNRGACRCPKQAVPSGEDVKPCLRCLNEIVNLPQNNPPGVTRIKQEMAEAVQHTLDNREEEGSAIEIDKAPFPLNPQAPNPVHRDLDLGLSSAYGSSELTLQLMKDIHATLTPPLSQRYPTPPVTPDQFNTQSPSTLGSASKEPRNQSGAFECEAGPSGLNNSHSLNDLVLDLPFTTSEEFIARYREDAESTAAQCLSVITNFPAARAPPLEEAEEVLPMVDESLVIADEPEKVVGQPVLVATEAMPIADKSVTVTNNPRPIEDAPMSIEDESLPIVDKRTHIQADHLPVANDHVQIADKQVLVSDGPIPIADDSVLISGEPVPIAEVPIPIAEVPIPIAEVPAPIAEVPVPIAGEPVPITGEPVRMAGETVQMAGETVQIAGEPVQMAGEPVPIAGEPMPRVNEPCLVAEEPLPMVNEPMLRVNEPLLIADQPMPVVDENLAEDELEYEMLGLPLPPTVLHRHVSFGNVFADAFAIIPDYETEVVERYICRHCLMSFQMDTLMTHMYSELGRPTTQDIIAVYLVA